MRCGRGVYRCFTGSGTFTIIVAIFGLIAEIGEGSANIR